MVEGEREKKLPVRDLSVGGGVSLVFWSNPIKKGNQEFEVLSPSITKSWKTGEGVFEHRNVNISMNDLYRLLSMGNAVKDVEDAWKEEQKEKRLAEAKVEIEDVRDMAADEDYEAFQKWKKDQKGK